MAVMLLRFPGRRYHATPWGHHVNEGLIEWPPSPWRLLRALLSVGYTTLGWSDENPPETACSLATKLAGTLPFYRLPPACGTHSRHYMPIGKLDEGCEKTTLVFDTWAQVVDGELAVHWNVSLDAEETALLAALAERLGYLGRSESWVLARLATAQESLSDCNCFPETERPRPGPDWEQVSLLAPVPADGYAGWRSAAVAGALAACPLPDGKKQPSKALLAKRARIEAPYPPDLTACLQVETDWLHRHGWSQPPGSRRVLYWRRRDALETGTPRPRMATADAPPVEAVLLVLASGSGNDHALPPVRRTLPQAELLHRALVSRAAALSGHSPVLAGCDAERIPLRGRHGHAHLLPVDADGDGHLDHVLIWAPMGLDAAAQAAIRAVRQTFTKGGIGPLRLALAGTGSCAELRGLPALEAGGLLDVLGPDAGVREWISATPFVPPRYLKPSGRHSLVGQVQAELATRGFPMATEVQLLDAHSDERARRQRHFVRLRRNGPQPPIDCGFTLRLRFGQAVRGPLCLGYGSHFGLGLFRVDWGDSEPSGCR